MNCVEDVLPPATFTAHNDHVVRIIWIQGSQFELESSLHTVVSFRGGFVSLRSSSEMAVGITEHAHPPLLLGQLMMAYIKHYGYLHGLYLCHAASVRYQEKVLLIPGKEGRGKTTFCRQLPAVCMLNEDLTLIQFQDNVQNIYVIPDLHRLDVQPEPFKWRGPFGLTATVFLRREPPYGLSRLNEVRAQQCLLEDNPVRRFGSEGQVCVEHRDEALYSRWIENLTGMYPVFVLSYDLTVHQSSFVESCLKPL